MANWTMLSPSLVERVEPRPGGVELDGTWEGDVLGHELHALRHALLVEPEDRDAIRIGMVREATVGAFSPNGVDIGRRLVSAGWALAYRRYSKDYVAAEGEARKARRGMWRGTFVKPWSRASSPPRRTQAAVLATCGGRERVT